MRAAQDNRPSCRALCKSLPSVVMAAQRGRREKNAIGETDGMGGNGWEFSLFGKNVANVFGELRWFKAIFRRQFVDIISVHKFFLHAPRKDLHGRKAIPASILSVTIFRTST